MGHILGKKMSQRKGEVNSMTEFIIEFNKLAGIMGRRHAQNFFFFLVRTSGGEIFLFNDQLFFSFLFSESSSNRKEAQHLFCFAQFCVRSTP